MILYIVAVIALVFVVARAFIVLTLPDDVVGRGGKDSAQTAALRRLVDCMLEPIIFVPLIGRILGWW